MRRALVRRGADESRLYPEERSTSTQENLRYSRAILEELGVDPAQRVAIVTSDFHLCRARLMWGGDTAAVPAHLPSTLYFQCLTVNYFIREAFGLARLFCLRRLTMNKDILCLYYSRTGHTKFAMEEIAAALDCECVEMRDRVDRDGAIGWLRCGWTPCAGRTRAMEPFDTRRALQDYRLVILGTPIWADAARASRLRLSQAPRAGGAEHRLCRRPRQRGAV